MRTSPLVAGAAACVIASCMIAAAAVSGVIPSTVPRTCSDCGIVAAEPPATGAVTRALIDSQFGAGDGRRLVAPDTDVHPF